MCVLRADGKNFAVDRFLKNSSLKPVLIYYKGNSDGCKGIYQSSGFNVAVSDADFDNLQSQISDALIFLKKENAELKRLIEFENVEGASIDFPVGAPPDDINVWTRSFPPELLKLLGSIGIGLDFTVYPKSL
jgi:hypothetical protein